MFFLRSIADGLRALFRRERVDRELNEELLGFLDRAVEEKIKRGMSREHALRSVRLERGDMEVTKEEIRAAGWESLAEGFWQDLCFAVRLLRRTPLFTVTVVVTVAVAIAANTTIFSVVNAEMLRPLPFRDPDGLVQVAEKNDKLNLPTFSSSVLNFLSWREQAKCFDGLAAMSFSNFTLSGNGEPEQYSGNRISSELTRVLGLPPLAGRDFTDDEDKPSAPAVATRPSRSSANPCGNGASAQTVGSSVVLSFSTACRQRWWALLLRR